VAVRFSGQLKAWILKYLRSQRWRFAGMLDDQDIQQEAYALYLDVKKRHPEIKDPIAFLKLLKSTIPFRIRTIAKSCFPNPYNFSTDGSTGAAVSLTNPEDGSSIEPIAAARSFASDVEDAIDLLQAMPDELKSICIALIREAFGFQTIPARSRRRLAHRNNPRGVGVESLDSALRNAFQIDPLNVPNFSPFDEILKHFPKGRQKLRRVSNVVYVYTSEGKIEYNLPYDPGKAIETVIKHLRALGNLSPKYAGAYKLVCSHVQRQIVVRKKKGDRA
jgi:hypothetical protein